jgi:hypothetical protein
MPQGQVPPLLFSLLIVIFPLRLIPILNPTQNVGAFADSSFPLGRVAQMSAFTERLSFSRILINGTNR